MKKDYEAWIRFYMGFADMLLCQQMLLVAHVPLQNL